MANINPLSLYLRFNKNRGFLNSFILSQYLKLLDGSKVIVVLGSIGKSTTLYASKTIISDKFKTITTEDLKYRDLDIVSQIQRVLLDTASDIQKVFLEIDLPVDGEVLEILKLVKPQTVIITNLYQYWMHDEYFVKRGVDMNLKQDTEDMGGIDKIVNLLDSKGLLIVNWEDSVSRNLAEKTKAQVLFYGTDPAACHIWAGNMRINDFQTVFELNWRVERVEVRSNLLGFHHVYPLLAASSLAVNCGIPLISIKRDFEKIESIEHRLQVLGGYNGSIILDDSTDSHPLSMHEALETLNQVSARRRIVVLGEMKDLGAKSEKLHRDVARKIFKDKIDVVFTAGGDSQFIADELNKLGFLSERVKQLQNPQIVTKLLKILVKGDVVLVKGSYTARLDEVVKKITKKRTDK